MKSPVSSLWFRLFVVSIIAGVVMLSCSKSTDSDNLVVSVSGFVRDGVTMAPIAGAAVSITGVINLPATVTNDQGFYRLFPNRYGVAYVHCDMNGYHGRTDSVVMAAPEKTYEVEFQLQPVTK